MKARMKAINIKVEFGRGVVTLADEDDRKTTSEGVEIYIEKLPANEMRPIAVIPDGTLEKFKHCRPQVLKITWVEQ